MKLKRPVFLYSILIVGLVSLVLFFGFRSSGAQSSSNLIPLHMEIVKDSTSHFFKLGNRQLELRLESLDSGDNGKAAIHVIVDGLELTVIESYFDYDLWQNEAPASYQRGFFDNDRHRDIRLILNPRYSSDVYLISSEDGTITIEAKG